MELKAFRKRFDPILGRVADDLSRRATIERSTPAIDAVFSHARDMLAGGKRVRPFIAWSAFCFSGGDHEDDGVLELLSSLEFFQLFALIHDDIMDHAQTRRGMLAAHRAYAAFHETHDRLGDAGHAGSSLAILVGDALLGWAFAQMASGGQASPDLRLAAIREFNEMVREVVLGQLMDVDLSTRHASTMEEVLEKNALKTAAYTFVRPMRIGLVLAGGSEDGLRFCNAFGEALGQAFQIQDDYLDLVSDEATLGKPALSDLREHQHTAFTAAFLEEATEADREVFVRAWGSNDLDGLGREDVLALLERSGALARGTALMEERFVEAERLANEAPFDAPDRRRLVDIVQAIRGRTK